MADDVVSITYVIPHHLMSIYSIKSGIYTWWMKWPALVLDLSDPTCSRSMSTTTSFTFRPTDSRGSTVSITLAPEVTRLQGRKVEVHANVEGGSSRLSFNR